MSDNRPKLQHYVPQFYLRGFQSSLGNVWQYDAVQNALKEIGIPVVAAANDLYTFEDEEGNKRTDIEKEFARLEGRFSRVISKIDETDELSPVDRVDLAIFCGLQYLRTPKNHDRIQQATSGFAKWSMRFMASNQEHFYRHLDHLEEENPDLVIEDKEKLRQFILEDDYEVSSTSNAFFLENVVESIEEISNIIKDMEWALFRAPRESQFVTSDDPFTMLLSRKRIDLMDGPGLKIPGTEISIPLTSKTCLVMATESRKSLRCGSAPKALVRLVNLRTTDTAYRFLYGGNRLLLESLVSKTRIFDKRPIRQLVRVG